MSLQPPPKIIKEFSPRWPDWLFFFWENVKSHTGGATPTPPTTGLNWNAHGNIAIGGGDFSVDANLSMPEGSAYQIAGVDIVARDSVEQLTIGPNNTNFPGSAETTPNIQIGSGLVAFGGNQRESVNVGLRNNVLWQRDVGVGIDILLSENIGNGNIGFGDNIELDRGAVGLGKNLTLLRRGFIGGVDCSYSGSSGQGVFIQGIDCTGSSSPVGATYVSGVDCSATGDNCGALGIGINNDQSNSFKLGPNNDTAIVVAGSGLGVAIAIPQARIHLGAGSTTVPSITMNVSNQLITFPIAGSIEYSSQTVTGLTIVSSTTADPIEITTSAPHFFADGGIVTVSNNTTGSPFTGTVNSNFLNGEYAIVVTGDSTFEIPGVTGTSSVTDGDLTAPANDRFIYFTHQDGTRANVVVNHAVHATSAQSPYTVKNIDTAILGDTSAGGLLEIQLPPAFIDTDRMLNIKLRDNTALSRLDILPASGESIEDQAPDVALEIPVSQAGTSYQIISDGTAWYVI